MPKLSTFKQFPYTAELWDYTRKTDPSGGPIYTYAKSRTVALAVTQTAFGKITVSFKDDAGDIRDQAQLRKIVDKAGVPLQPNAVWTITGLVPIITPFGTREGYRGDAKWTYVDGI